MSIPITPRELRVIALLAEGCTNREIAKIIRTTENVVNNYLRTIFDKTGMWNRLELALWFVKEGTADKLNTVLAGQIDSQQVSVS